MGNFGSAVEEFRENFLDSVVRTIKIAATETPEHLKPYRKISDEHLETFLKAYRKAQETQYGKGYNETLKMAKYYMDSSPSPSVDSPLALIQPRHRNKVTYVQRWKVLRDRNKNLPKLDFNAKAAGIHKKLQDAPSFSRSYTYDSMKLPSISNSSVVTGFSGKSVQSDGYRRRDKERNIQDQQSESYTDLTNIGTQRDIEPGTNLSKSLQNIADIPSQQSNRDNEKDKSKHRFERISYQKHLSNRTREKSMLDRQETRRQNTMVKENSTLSQEESKKAAITKLQKDSLEQIQKRIGVQSLNGVKQYVYVKENRKDNANSNYQGSNYKNSSNYPNNTNYQNSLSSITTTSTVKRKSQEADVNIGRDSKSELPILEQSGMYQLDLSNLRNEIPPVHHDHVSSAGYRRRSGRGSRKGSSGRRRLLPQVPQVVEKKWRDGCDCLRCNIMRQQYADGDEGYKNWGSYPCINISKSRLRRDMYAYDSD